MFVDRRAHFDWDGDLTKIPTDQLEKITDRLLMDAYGGDMVVVEAAKKQILSELEAGNVIEAQYEIKNAEGQAPPPS
jgi:hypothetical protein